MSDRVSDQFLERLRFFVGIRSLAGDVVENMRAVDFVSACLRDAGFEVRVEGREHLDQPVIVARRPGVNSHRRILIYGHYDVAPVLDSEEWCVDKPFTVSRLDGRLYGRGVADNKGTLLARLFALSEAHRSGSAVPELCWLIQGKEEVMQACSKTASIFRNEVLRFHAEIYVDETGFNDVDSGERIVFLWSRSGEHESSEFAKFAIKAARKGRVESRHLNKLNGGENCPLLCAMPRNGVYLGFGPNDRLHNIHRGNESLDESRLAAHKADFLEFLNRYARY